jgi:hypothetical protein
MRKVKVQRYVSGKKPGYAINVSDESSAEEDFIDNRKSIIFNKVRDLEEREEIDER